MLCVLISLIVFSIILLTDGRGKVLSNRTEANPVGSGFFPPPIASIEVYVGLDNHDVIGRVLQYQYLGAGKLHSHSPPLRISWPLAIKFSRKLTGSITVKINTRIRPVFAEFLSYSDGLDSVGAPRGNAIVLASCGLTQQACPGIGHHLFAWSWKPASCFPTVMDHEVLFARWYGHPNQGRLPIYSASWIFTIQSPITC